MSDPLAPQVPRPPRSRLSPAGGFFQNLIDVYFSPREAFTRIVRKPAVRPAPAPRYLVLVLAFTGIWMQKIDAREFMKAQIEECGSAERIPAEQRRRSSSSRRSSCRSSPRMGPDRRRGHAPAVRDRAASSSSSTASSTRSEATFRQSLAIVTWVFFAVGLVTTPLMPCVMALKGDWNINPQEALQANLGLFLDKSTAAKPLWSLPEQHRPLHASGPSSCSRRASASPAARRPAPPSGASRSRWALLVLGKVGWAAIF